VTSAIRNMLALHAMRKAQYYADLLRYTYWPYPAAGSYGFEMRKLYRRYAQLWLDFARALRNMEEG